MDMLFSKSQKRILGACIVIYTAAYFNRLNLSAALGSIISTLHISIAKAGLLQTAFAVVYAAGQLINGTLVDRINPVRHMLIGLSGSAVCNFLMGISVSYPVIWGLCLLNGAFQSMLWTPIVRLIALHFNQQKAREKANIFLFMALVFGHMGAWAISGYLSGITSWRFSFIVPAFIAIPALFVGSALLKNMVQIPKVIKQKAVTAKASGSAFKVFSSTGFFLVLFSSVLFGFIRDGIVTWSPNILRSFSRGNSFSSTTFSLLIPLINAFGMFVGYVFQQRKRQNNHQMIAKMLLCSSCFCFPLLFANGMLPAAMLMGACCACMNGASPILTTLIPMEYDKVGYIGLAAGLIDCFIYIGSALAGVLAGSIYDTFSIKALYGTWLLSGAGAALSMWISGRKAANQACVKNEMAPDA